MGWFNAPEYWLGRLILERGIAVVYVFAFVAAARQFRALIGEHGLLPVPRYLAGQSFRQTPSVFHVHYSDRFFATVAWLGALLSAAMAVGLADVLPLWAAVLLWLLLWVLYLSIVNVGQTWYSFGWESLLLEAGFLAIFLGNDRVAPPLLAMWLARLLLFRLEFGAGLIKLRGDSCWRDLTALYYHHETQPMPGPLSWFFHHLPKPLHRVEVLGNHFAQLIVPFGLFAPQPVASIAGAIVVITQLWLVVSGNFAWLNWLTILLGCSVIDASSAAAVLPIPKPPALAPVPPWFAGLVIVFAVLTVMMTYYPVRNMISRRQRMNMSFNAYHLINTYGAFGTIGRTPIVRIQRLAPKNVVVMFVPEPARIPAVHVDGGDAEMEGLRRGFGDPAAPIIGPVHFLIGGPPFFHPELDQPGEIPVEVAVLAVFLVQPFLHLGARGHVLDLLQKRNAALDEFFAMTHIVSPFRLFSPRTR